MGNWGEITLLTFKVTTQKYIAQLVTGKDPPCNMEPKNPTNWEGKLSEPNLHDSGFSMLIFQGVFYL